MYYLKFWFLFRKKFFCFFSTYMRRYTYIYTNLSKQPFLVIYNWKFLFVYKYTIGNAVCVNRSDILPVQYTRLYRENIRIVYFDCVIVFQFIHAVWIGYSEGYFPHSAWIHMNTKGVYQSQTYTNDRGIAS